MSKNRLYIESTATGITNPGKNYGIKQEGQRQYVGYVRSWEQRVRFGKHLPVPWMKEYTVRADTEDDARVKLGRLAYNDGYALGGVQDIALKG